MLLPIRYIFLRHLIEIILHKFLFNDILDFLYADILAILDIPLNLTGYFIDIFLRHPATAIHIGPGNCIENLLTIVAHGMA